MDELLPSCLSCDPGGVEDDDEGVIDFHYLKLLMMKLDRLCYLIL